MRNKREKAGRREGAEGKCSSYPPVRRFNPPIDGEQSLKFCSLPERARLVPRACDVIRRQQLLVLALGHIEG